MKKSYISTLIFFFVFIANVLANEISLPESMQETKQCEYDSEYMSLGLKLNTWKRAPSSYLSPYELNQKLGKSNDILLVDTRASRDYSKNHVKGAFNFPGSSLVTNKLFQKKEVVLIGSGVNYRKNENLRENLVSAGFVNVKILDGGFDFWRTGINRRKKESFMSGLGQILFGDRLNWIIVNSTNLDIDKKIFNQVLNDDVTDLRSLHMKINLRLKSQQEKLIRNVLVIIEDNKDVNYYENQVHSNSYANIYFIEKSKYLSSFLFFNDTKNRPRKKRTDGAQFDCG